MYIVNQSMTDTTKKKIIGMPCTKETRCNRLLFLYLVVINALPTTNVDNLQQSEHIFFYIIYMFVFG